MPFEIKKKRVRKSRTIYYINCKRCDNEIQVENPHKKSFLQPIFPVTNICYSCREKDAIKKAKETASFMIGAKIVDVTVKNSGTHSIASELDTVVVETKDGQKLVFSVGGYDEQYIGWERVES